MSSDVSPYLQGELFGELEGQRNLHDDANKFYRDVMHLKTPLAQKDLPRCSVVKTSILNAPKDNAMTNILFSLRATPMKNLWPEETQVPGHFIGVLWKAVHDTLPVPKGFDSHEVKDPMPAELFKNSYLPLSHFLDPKNRLLVPNDTYFKLLQDPGFEVKGKTRPKKCFIDKDDSSSKSRRAYKDVYDLSCMFYDILKEHPSTFTKLPKNKSVLIQKIAKILIDNRELKGYGDVDDETIRDFVEKEGLNDNTQNSSIQIYIYEQNYLFTKLYNCWCPVGVEKDEVTINDKLRVFGILTSVEYRDDMENLTRGKAADREELDNPEYRPGAVYNKFASAFNDSTFVISHPVDYHKLENSVILNANEVGRVNIKRNGDWIKRIYENTMKHYRAAMYKWKMGTGGGEGYPENYANWELRESHQFQNYDKMRGTLLGWIYMKDSAANFPLDAKNSDIPEDIQVESCKGISQGHSHHSSSTRGKSPSYAMMSNLDKRLDKWESFSEEYFHNKTTMSDDQRLQIQLDNIKNLATLSGQFGNDESRKRRFDEKIQDLLDDVLEPKKPRAVRVLENNDVGSGVAAAIEESVDSP